MNKNFLEELSQKLYNDQDNIILQEQMSGLSKEEIKELQKELEETEKKLVMKNTDYIKQIYLTKLIEKYGI